MQRHFKIFFEEGSDLTLATRIDARIQQWLEKNQQIKLVEHQTALTFAPASLSYYALVVTMIYEGEETYTA